LRIIKDSKNPLVIDGELKMKHVQTGKFWNNMLLAAAPANDYLG
jgi:hypothetical protein